jgi:hypothetical protein
MAAMTGLRQDVPGRTASDRACGDDGANRYGLTLQEGIDIASVLAEWPEGPRVEAGRE